MANNNRAVPLNASDLRRMQTEDSAIPTYHQIIASNNSDINFKFNSRLSESNSNTSFPTSNYSETDSGAGHKTRMSIRESLPTHHTRMDSKLSNLSTTSIQTIGSPPKMKSSAFTKLDPGNNDRLYNSGALAIKLDHHRIRESVEMDPFASLRNTSASVASPHARLSEIERKSVLTLRMIQINGKPQIRLKLYLPLVATINDSIPPQIIMLFVNKGVDLLSVRMFLEDNYPHKVLKGRIKQICIADEDGDIDDDFPPINDHQDITSLGVTDFWIMRIFDSSNRPSTVFSGKENTHRSDTNKYGSVQEYTVDENEKRCCWCFRWNQIVQNEENNLANHHDAGKYSVTYSDYQKLVLHESTTSMENNTYQPPKMANNALPDNNAESSETPTNVQFACI